MAAAPLRAGPVESVGETGHGGRRKAGDQVSLCSVAGGEVVVMAVTGKPRVLFLSLLSTQSRPVFAEVEGPAAA